MKRWLIAAASAMGLMVFPAAAAATTCGDDGTTQLFDSQGYYFDFTDAGTTADRNDAFATLSDSGSNGPAGTPPGPVSNSDSYDQFGALFVGGTDVSNMYFSADNNSCSDPTAGEHDFPVVQMGSLRVQRKVFVNPSGSLPGARILDLLSNPTGASVTTKVQVGDLQSAEDLGDLGSDDDSATRFSSSGDAVTSPGDLWSVTNDQGVPATPDNSLAHIVDGKDGAVKADVFQLGPGTDADPADNLVWGWTVTVPAGQTIGLMSFEVQQGSPGLPSATDAASAAAVANTYENTPLATLTQGMSPTEVANVVNWQPSNEFTATARGKRLLVSVKSPGTVSVVDARTLSAVEAKKKKKKRPAGLKPSSASGNPPTITVPLLLNKAAKARLKAKGKVTFNAKITFTPSGGTKVPKTVTQSLKIKVKKKKHKK